MILLNDGQGNGTFLAPVNVAVGSNPSAIAAGDFNGDTFIDLAVTNKGNTPGDTDTVTILIKHTFYIDRFFFCTL